MALALTTPPHPRTGAAHSSRRRALTKWVSVLIAVAGAVIASDRIHAFLAASEPVGRGVLAVEAWIPATALAESVKLFDSGRYQAMLLVGGPIPRSGVPPGGATTYDELAVRRLNRLGFDTRKILRIAVPFAPLGRRTVSTADAVRQWLDRRPDRVCCIEVFTVGTHARKSEVLFRHELSGRCRVGVVAASEFYTRGRSWFVSARGISTFLRDLVGYVYAQALVIVDHAHVPRSAHARMFFENGQSLITK